MPNLPITVDDLYFTGFELNGDFSIYKEKETALVTSSQFAWALLQEKHSAISSVAGLYHVTLSGLNLEKVEAKRYSEEQYKEGKSITPEKVLLDPQQITDLKYGSSQLWRVTPPSAQS